METLVKAGRPYRYPWRDWLVPGQTTVLVRGRDYRHATASMEQQVRNWASRLRVSVRIEAGDDRLTVEVVGRLPAAKRDWRIDRCRT